MLSSPSAPAPYLVLFVKPSWKACTWLKQLHPAFPWLCLLCRCDLSWMAFCAWVFFPFSPFSISLVKSNCNSSRRGIPIPVPLHNPELVMDAGAGGWLGLCCDRHGCVCSSCSILQCLHVCRPERLRRYKTQGGFSDGFPASDVLTRAWGVVAWAGLRLPAGRTALSHSWGQPVLAEQITLPRKALCSWRLGPSKCGPFS